MPTTAAQPQANGAPIPPNAPQPTDHQPKQPTQAQRIEKLEGEVAQLKAEVAAASRILASFVENNAVQAAMPQIEQQIRGQVQQAYAQGGLAALLPQEGPPNA
jgi:hypothetical protein